MFWFSFFQYCFVFINRFPLPAIFTGALFSPRLFCFSCCTVAGWHGRMSRLKEINMFWLSAKKFLCMTTKRVLTIYFALDVIILTCSTGAKKYILLFYETFSLSLVQCRPLMEVHFQLFKPVSKAQLIWSPYSLGYLAIFLCTCQYPVSWCHCKLCTVPFTLSAIHVNQPCPPYSFNLLSTWINHVPSDSRACQYNQQGAAGLFLVDWVSQGHKLIVGFIFVPPWAHTYQPVSNIKVI